MDRENILRICKKCEAKCCRLGGPTCTRNEVKKILFSGAKNKFYKVSENLYEVETTNENGVCPYLSKNDGCSIYKLRPLVCKCWPVFPKISGNKRKYILVECPLAKKLSKKEIKEYRKEAKKLDNKLIKLCWDNSTIPSSREQAIVNKRLKKFKIKILK